MRRSKTNKPSSSTFKLQAATPRPQARTSRPSRAFSLLQYPFAIPLGLRNLLRLAAVMVLLAQVPAQAEGGSARSLAIQLKPGESPATSNSVPSSDSPSS